MLNKIVLLLLVTALGMLLLPTPVDAYGAAHTGSTAVGPNGAYHTGEDTARAYGPRGNRLLTLRASATGPCRPRG
jgi:hypothetical protein